MFPFALAFTCRDVLRVVTSCGYDIPLHEALSDDPAKRILV